MRPGVGTIPAYTIVWLGGTWADALEAAGLASARKPHGPP